MKGRPKGGSKSAARANAAPPPKLKRVPTIIELMDHPELLRPWFKDPETWSAWRTLLKELFALPMTEEELALYRQCTGRSGQPTEAFLEASLIIGRRGGKSFVMALIAVYLAVFRDYDAFVVPGERLVLPVLASDKKQAKSVWKYAHAMLTQVEVLRPYLAADGDGLLELSNGVAIEIYAASFRSVRGVTIVSAILDEVAFFRSDEDSANPDREIVDAITPGMATIPGALLLLASSPYARRGVLYENFQRHHGRDGAPVLVWKAPSLVMHPSERLRKIVEAAYERDPASAAAEYGAEFRSDLEAFVTEEVINSVTVAGR